MITREFLRKQGACLSDEEIAAKVPLEGLSLRAILELEDVIPEHKVWVATCDGVLPDQCARLFAVRCARRALARVAAPDPRSVAACDVAERFAKGEADSEELAAAVAAAWSAAETAAERASQVQDLLIYMVEPTAEAGE
jgi:hypothetical protein